MAIVKVVQENEKISEIERIIDSGQVELLIKDAQVGVHLNELIDTDFTLPIEWAWTHSNDARVEALVCHFNNVKQICND